ncbi:unknown [Clostridium sp. CAG:967]|nr:unknown [Clostridium sp. CAG:967]
MLKKIVTPSCNVCDSVEFILRGARKRRSMAIAAAKNMNADAGIQARLHAVK